MQQLSGVVGALLTPFDDSGDVDYTLLNQELEFMAGHCDSVSILGAEVSEYRTLSADRRRRLLRHVLAEASGRTTTLAGVSAPTISEVAELADLAATAGADYVQLLMPRLPSGGDPSDADLVRFIEAAVAECELPVVLYHHPAVGADPSLSALVDATAVDGVRAIKDSSRNITRNLRAVEEIQHAGHASYLATMQPMLAVMLSGGAGAMMPPPFTLVGASIRDAVAAGDLHRAGTLQQLLGRFPGPFTHYGLLAMAKAGMAAIGRPLGPPAPPFAPIPEPQQAQIAERVASWPDALSIDEHIRRTPQTTP